jgi:hypothetical protein
VQDANIRPPGATVKKMAVAATSSVQSRQVGMSPVRSVVVNGFILGYLLLTALLFVTGYELWPFCTYWMYEGTLARGDGKAIEFYTVADGREKWIDIQSGPVLQWVFSFEAVAKKDGWSDPRTKRFLATSLEEMRRESRTDHPSEPLPTAIRVYSSDYHFPDSGDYQAIRTGRTLILEVDRERP